jgi:hypothetical protein
MGGPGGTASLSGFWCAPIDPEFVVQVWTRRQTRHPHKTDHVALIDTLACVQPVGEPGQVPVSGAVSVVVLHDYQIAVAAALPTNCT